MYYGEARRRAWKLAQGALAVGVHGTNWTYQVVVGGKVGSS